MGIPINTDEELNRILFEIGRLTENLRGANSALEEIPDGEAKFKCQQSLKQSLASIRSIVEDLNQTKIKLAGWFR